MEAILLYDQKIIEYMSITVKAIENKKAGIFGINKFPTAPIPAMSAPILSTMEGKLIAKII